MNLASDMKNTFERGKQFYVFFFYLFHLLFFSLTKYQQRIHL